MEYRGLELDKFQVEAIKLLKSGVSVVVCAPTGSGKTLIAEYLVENELSKGNNVIYTAPIKAVNNQKFRDFSRIFGEEKIGILTGDVTVNPQANCLVMTTEILRNMVLDKDERLHNVSYIIFDEVHYMDDMERGSVWEESFIYAPKNIRFLCLSATIANIDELCSWLTELREEKFSYILKTERPVPLKIYGFCDNKFILLSDTSKKSIFSGNIKKTRRTDRSGELFKLIKNLHQTDKLPVISFVFSRMRTEILAKEFSSMDFLSEQERKLLKQTYYRLISRLNIEKQFLENLERFIFRGICYHHAGLLPSVKELIEQLFTTGLIKVLFATETFALGVDFPARSIIFIDLFKKQNGQVKILQKRNFLQMAGRAGRRGIDKVGYAYILVTKNVSSELLRSFVMDKNIEPINSRFNLTYATILNLYKDLGENIVDAFEKSFAYFMLKKNAHFLKHNRIKENLQNKLRLLKHLRYVYNFQLTSKGVFASKLYGHELFVTETFFDGLLDKLSSQEIAVIFSALIYDSHIRCMRNCYELKSDIILKIEKKCADIMKIEKKYKISNLSFKGLNYALAKETSIWFKGGTLEELYRVTDVYLGDIIRHFRQIIQLCREVLEIVKDYKSFSDKLDEVITKLNRGEVDAYRQLKSVD